MTRRLAARVGEGVGGRWAAMREPNPAYGRRRIREEGATAHTAPCPSLLRNRSGSTHEQP